MRPLESRWVHLGASSRPQHGGFTLAQSVAAGFTRRQRERLLATGAWVPVLPDVFREATTPETPELLRWAAFVWSGGGIVSHRSAGELWEMPGIVASRPELTVVNRVAPRHPRVVVHRTTAMPERRWMRGGVHVTGPERTILDLAGVVDHRALESALDFVIRRGLASATSVRDELARLGARGRRGASTLLRLLEEFAPDATSESMLERRIARVLRTAGVPPFVAQHPVTIDGRHYRLDLAWPQQRVALECDGRRHHSDAVAFTRDRRRASDLTAAGWRVLVATWHDLVVPGALVTRVLATLALAG